MADATVADVTLAADLDVAGRSAPRDRDPVDVIATGILAAPYAPTSPRFPTMCQRPTWIQKYVVTY